MMAWLFGMSVWLLVLMVVGCLTFDESIRLPLATGVIATIFACYFGDE